MDGAATSLPEVIMTSFRYCKYKNTNCSKNGNKYALSNARNLSLILRPPIQL